MRTRIPRKISTKLFRLSARYKERTIFHSFTLKTDINYQEILVIGPKVIPALIEAAMGKMGGAASWRLDLIRDIALKYNLARIEDFKTVIEAQLEKDFGDNYKDEITCARAQNGSAVFVD